MESCSTVSCLADVVWQLVQESGLPVQHLDVAPCVSEGNQVAWPRQEGDREDAAGVGLLLRKQEV